MKFFFYLCLLALVALATGMPLSSPLNVTLTSTGTSNMQVTIQNVGESEVALVTAGSLFDPRPVQKVTMHSGSTPLVFRGMIVDPKPIAALVPTDLTKIHAGQSFSVQFDAAEMYDLSSGGNFTAEAAGSIWDAESFGFISYKSNPVKITVGGVETAMVERRDDPPEDIPKIGERCDDDQKKKIEEALGGCSLYADAGAHATWNKTSNHFFLRYFKSSKEADLDLVHDRLIAISNDCLALFGPIVQVDCASQMDRLCGGDKMGYTTRFKDGRAYITLCGHAFAYSEPIDESSCTKMDMAGFLVAQHASFQGVYDPPTTRDIEEYEKSLGLTARKALVNAGSYRYFGKAAYLDCKS
ncbi:putative neutral protease 2 protein [Lasiodiplodia theobromae]|nr:putative neutral protease 2 protein [Lasiodiplodia theobromae]